MKEMVTPYLYTNWELFNLVFINLALTLMKPYSFMWMRGELLSIHQIAWHAHPAEAAPQIDHAKERSRDLKDMV
jgi:hypothetical protein